MGNKDKDKDIHKGHRERMRNKFLKTEFESFEDHEIIEFLLFYAIPRVNTNPIAHRLIKEFKTFGKVCNADLSELVKIEGLGEKGALFLKAIPKIANAYILSANKIQNLSDEKAITTYFKNRYIGVISEKVIIACLDDRLNLIADTVIADGEPESVSISVRKIAEFAFKHNCSNVIISHNHPNSHAIPSDEDLKATTELYKILRPIGVNLLDHIIVGNNGDVISLKNSGAFSGL